MLTTITGKLQLADGAGAAGYVEFLPQSAPYIHNGAIIMPRKVRAQASSDGQFTVVLYPGLYLLRTIDGQQMQIDVPSDGQTHDISTIQTSGLIVSGNLPAAQTYLTTVTADERYRTPRGYVNVRELGAYGDGEHDDTEAFQEAAASGRHIYIPGRPDNWTYVVSDEIALKTRQEVFGDGVSSVVTTTHATKPIFLVEGVNDVSFRSLCIRGRGATFDWVKDGHNEGIMAFAARRLRVVDCVFENFWQHGIFGQAIFDSVIARNRFHKWPFALDPINDLPTWDRAAIMLWQVAEDNVIEDNIIDGAIAFDGNVSQTGLIKIGIMLQCVQGEGGLDLDPATERWVYEHVNYGSMRRNILRGNIVVGCSRYGLCLYKKDTITEDNFRDNDIHHNDVRDVSGFSQSSGTYCTGAGIYNQSPTHTYIHHNTVRNCGWRNRNEGLAGHGITCGGEYCRVNDNLVEDCPAGGIKHFFTVSGETNNNTSRRCGGIMTRVTAASGDTTIPFPDAYRVKPGDTVKIKHGGTNYSASAIMTRTVASVDVENNTITFTAALDNNVSGELAWFVPNGGPHALFVKTLTGVTSGGIVRGNVLDECVGDFAAYILNTQGILVVDNVLRGCMGNLIIDSCASPVVRGNLTENMGNPAYVSTKAGCIHLEACTDVMVTGNRVRDPGTSKPGRTALITASTGTTGTIWGNRFDTGQVFVPVFAPGCEVRDNMIGGAQADVRMASATTGARSGIVTMADSAAPSVRVGTVFACADHVVSTTMFNDGVLGKVVSVSCTSGSKTFVNGTWIKTKTGSNLVLTAGQVAVFMALEINASDYRLVWYQIL